MVPLSRSPVAAAAKSRRVTRAARRPPRATQPPIPLRLTPLKKAQTASCTWQPTREGDKIVGIDAEIAEAICGKLGYTLVIDDMDFDSIITAVQSGKADFGMAGMTVTDERKQAIDFTDTYTNAIQVIIVKEGSDKIKSADDLKGASVGVQMGTTGDIYVTDLEKDGTTVERFNKGADAVLALSQGKVDAVVIDNEPAKAFVKQNEGLTILEEPFENEEYAICVAKGSDLTEKINGALKELKAEGKVDEIINKYIKA